MRISKLKELIKASRSKVLKETDSSSKDLLSTLKSKLEEHDWYYMMSDDNRKYLLGLDEQKELRALLTALGNSTEAKELYNKYAPFRKEGPDMRVTEDVNEGSELEIPTATLTKANNQVKSLSTMSSLLLNLYDTIQTKEQIDFSKNSKFKRALDLLRDLTDEKSESSAKVAS